jgi:ATP-binding cassette, subfamily B, bacterial
MPVEPDWETEADIDAEEETSGPRLATGSLRSAWSLLAPHAGSHRRRGLLLALAVLLDTGLNVSFPLVERWVVDDGLIRKDWTVVATVIAYILVAAVLVTGLGLLMDVLNARIASGITARIRASLFDKLRALPIDYFNRTETGEILSRFSGDVLAIEGALVGCVPWLVLPALEVAYSTALMFVFNWRLGLIGLLVFPLNLFAPRALASRSFALGYEKRRREARLMSMINETVSAQPVIRAFGLDPVLKARFSKLSEEWRLTAFRFDLTSALVERATYSGVYLVHALVFGVGAYWAFEGEISIGTLVAFEAMFLTMGDAISHVTESVPMFAEASGAVRHLQEFHAEPATKREPAGAIQLPRPVRDVVFSGVSFSYPGGRFRLQNVDLTVKVGTRTAIVGRSGSGKSTLGALLMRFQEPDEGAILFDGQDIRAGTRASLRTLIAPVFQDTFLFHASIGENIAIGRPDATQDEIEAAARAAELHDFIVSLPQGYETIAGERGANLSGGQRQRVAIARALLRDPAILLLDEATSALDLFTEAALQATIERISRDRTVIAVSHRLSGIADYDQIVLVDQGRVREVGPHRRLLRQGGLYAALWKRQSLSARGRHQGSRRT